MSFFFQLGVTLLVIYALNHFGIEMYGLVTKGHSFRNMKEGKKMKQEVRSMSLLDFMVISKNFMRCLSLCS